MPQFAAPPALSEAPAGGNAKWYVKDIVLSANQNSREVLEIDSDADFIWRAWTFTSTGTFSVQLADGSNYAFSNARIASANVSSDPANPTALEVEHRFPARSKMSIDILDTSGAGNTIQLAFIGEERTR